MGNGEKDVVILFCQTQIPPFDHYPYESYHNHFERVDQRNANWDESRDGAFPVDAGKWRVAAQPRRDHSRAEIDWIIG